MRRVTWFVLLLGVAGGVSAQAPAPKALLPDRNAAPLSIEDSLAGLSLAIRMPIALSPDGRLVAYTLEEPKRRESTSDERYREFTRTGAPVEAVGCDVWVTDTQSGKSRNLTEGKGTSWGPVWSPDGRTLAFSSDRSGLAHLWTWNPASDRIQQVSDAIVRPFFGFEVVRWTPDSRHILAKVLPEGLTIDQAADLIVGVAHEKPKSETAGVTVQLYESKARKPIDPKAPATTDPPTPVPPEAWQNRYLADLALVEVATGKVERIVKRKKILGTWISPDGKSAAFTDMVGMESATSQQPRYDLNIVSLADGRARVAAAAIRQNYGISVSFSPDSQQIAYTTAGSKGEGDCFLVSVSGGAPQPQKATEAEHPSFGDDHRAPLWDKRGANLYFLARGALWRVSLSDSRASEIARITDGTILEIFSPQGGGRFVSPDGTAMLVRVRDERTKRAGVRRVELATGKVTVLSDGDTFSNWDAAFKTDATADGRWIVYGIEDAQTPEDLWIADATFRQPRRITHINPRLEAYRFGKSRLIDYRSTDGQPLKGALLLPSDYVEGRRYPLIVDVYGGSSRSNSLNHFGLSGTGVENMQILATRGYAVLLPDAPLRKTSPMRDLANTVLPGVSRAVELGIADPERLGVMGHSYGGYSTLSLIVQSTRFHAAVVSAGMGDLFSMYSGMAKDGGSFGIGWSEEGQGGMVGSPWEFRDRYLENSPFFYLDRVETPVLIVHGDLDETVPSFLADQIFVGLRRLGKEVSYAKYRGEEHWEGTWGYPNVVDYWNRVIAWFDTNLKKEGVGPQGSRSR